MLLPPYSSILFVPPRLLRHWDWDTGTPGHWYTKTLGHWDNRTLQWYTGTMKHRDNGSSGGIGVPTYHNRVVIFMRFFTIRLVTLTEDKSYKLSSKLWINIEVFSFLKRIPSLRSKM